MSGSLMIDGLMAFFAIVTLCGAAAPLLLLPKWMEGVRDKRIDFHRSAIDTLTAELARPQRQAAHAQRLAVQRERNIVALRDLVPGASVPPLYNETQIGLAA
jgi:hypothetical protein